MFELKSEMDGLFRKIVQILIKSVNNLRFTSKRAIWNHYKRTFVRKKCRTWGSTADLSVLERNPILDQVQIIFSDSKLKSYVSQQLTFMFEIKNNSKQNEKKRFEQ